MSRLANISDKGDILIQILQKTPNLKNPKKNPKNHLLFAIWSEATLKFLFAVRTVPPSVPRRISAATREPGNRESFPTNSDQILYQARETLTLVSTRRTSRRVVKLRRKRTTYFRFTRACEPGRRNISGKAASDDISKARDRLPWGGKMTMR